MNYTRLFDPSSTPPDHATFAPIQSIADRRDGLVYVYTPEIILAINVAMATRRPLLVRGPSGCGKSSLARHVSRVLSWRYYDKVISSRTQAQDLLWEVDHLRRLQDAHAHVLSEDLESYIRPGIFWWAFDQDSAREQVRRMRLSKSTSSGLDPNLGAEHKRAVVLLDEIDKADPDVPNNLLVPLGSLQFQVEETAALIQTPPDLAPLVIITSNDERELPTAFLRRCVELVLQPPDRQMLIEIGAQHFPEFARGDLARIAELIGEKSPSNSGTVPPSPAEYLDTIKACDELGVGPDNPVWEDLAKATLWKHGRTIKQVAEDRS